MAQAAEQKKAYHVTKDFRGLNTKANRTAIDQNEFSWLENVQPVGFANMKVVPAASNALATFTGETFYTVQSFNRNNTDYVSLFSGTGKGFEVNLGNTAVTANIGTANSLSTTGVTTAQWKNDRILIATPTKGLFSWDGNNLVSIGSIQTITVTAGGSGYPANTTVTLGAPNQAGGVQANATATISSGSITAITVTEAGSGYTSAPSVTITGSGGSNAAANATVFVQNATAVATFSGRTWLANARTLFYSATNTYNDFGTSTAGSTVFTDETLHSNITALQSANQYLYVFGTDSINVIGDVRVTGSPAVTVFTNTNISASVGTSNLYAVFPYFRSIMFMNRYGIFSLTGATTTKISDALDGIFPYIDFTLPVSGGQCLINNILCAVFQFTYNDPNSSTRVIQVVYFERKWFVTSQGTFKAIGGAPSGGKPNAYAIDDTKLYQVYSNTTANISSNVSTALWPMGDPIRDKQALKVGIEATFGNTVGNITATIDSENQSAAITGLAQSTNAVTWTNYALNTVNWTNNSSNTVTWITSNSYQLYKADAEMWGKYLGMTITSNSPAFTYNGFFTEHELRARF